LCRVRRTRPDERVRPACFADRAGVDAELADDDRSGEVTRDALGVCGLDDVSAGRVCALKPCLRRQRYLEADRAPVQAEEVEAEIDVVAAALVRLRVDRSDVAADVKLGRQVEEHSLLHQRVVYQRVEQRLERALARHELAHDLAERLEDAVVVDARRLDCRRRQHHRRPIPPRQRV